MDIVGREENAVNGVYLEQVRQEGEEGVAAEGGDAEQAQVREHDEVAEGAGVDRGGLRIHRAVEEGLGVQGHEGCEVLLGHRNGGIRVKQRQEDQLRDEERLDCQQQTDQREEGELLAVGSRRKG